MCSSRCGFFCLGDDRLTMSETAKRAALATLVVGGVVVLALALWKLRLVVALLFLAFILAAAMRPGVECCQARIPARRRDRAALRRPARGDRGSLGSSCRARSTRSTAVGGLPQTRSELRQRRDESTGIKHEILAGSSAGSTSCRPAESLVDPALEVTYRLRGRCSGSSSFSRAPPTGSSSATARRTSSARCYRGRSAEGRAGHLEPDRRQARRVRARPGAY